MITTQKEFTSERNMSSWQHYRLPCRWKLCQGYVSSIEIFCWLKVPPRNNKFVTINRQKVLIEIRLKLSVFWKFSEVSYSQFTGKMFLAKKVVVVHSIVLQWGFSDYFLKIVSGVHCLILLILCLLFF